MVPKKSQSAQRLEDQCNDLRGRGRFVGPEQEQEHREAREHGDRDEIGAGRHLLRLEVALAHEGVAANDHNAQRGNQDIEDQLHGANLVGNDGP